MNFSSPYTSAALVADALLLGPHWVYNQRKLKRIYTEGIHSYTDPASPYHPNRRAGQFTHYGDQTALLAATIERTGSFDLEVWRSAWVEMMKSYDGYVDGASKKTLETEGREPSDSDDLAGAARIAPILDLSLSLEDAVSATRQQTGLTHGSGILDAAEFVTRSVYALRDGATMEGAFQLAGKSGSYSDLKPLEDLEKARAADTENFMKVAAHFGLTCHLQEAFPLMLYFALRSDADFASAISDNGIAGGDSSARGMLLAVLFEARDKNVASAFPKPGLSEKIETHPGSNSIGIETPRGRLAGVLEMPEGCDPSAFAIFAHCFTCGKDYVPERRIARGLAEENIATLRIDFAGLGQSEGEFEDSSFVTNLEDLEAAAGWLSEYFAPPELLIGHSLGGSAVLSAASRVKSTKAVATIGAPADPVHVTHMFADSIGEIKEKGAAEVQLAGRPFVVGKRFLDDLEKYCHKSILQGLRGIDFLIMHAPKDTTVGIDNAGEIFSTLIHPKSFVSLADADHLLTNKEDAEYVARLIATWASRTL